MSWFVLDTNLYIEAARDASKASELAEFTITFLPRILLHAVVVQELMVVAVNAAARRSVQRDLVRPFERRGRVLVPTYAAWKRSGEIVARLVEQRKFSRGGVPRSFLNDALVAASCRELGATVVTRNHRDFARIREVESFSFVGPWPTK